MLKIRHWLKLIFDFRVGLRFVNTFFFVNIYESTKNNICIFGGSKLNWFAHIRLALTWIACDFHMDLTLAWLAIKSWQNLSMTFFEFDGTPDTNWRMDRREGENIDVDYFFFLFPCVLRGTLSIKTKNFESLAHKNGNDWFL